jgi:RNA polymerase sigma factor (sigma-70 family)
LGKGWFDIFFKNIIVFTFNNQPFHRYLRDGSSKFKAYGILMNEEIELQELIKACRSRDRKSQDKLYKQFYSYAMGICLRYSRSRAEAIEILNDGFYKIMTNFDKYSAGLSFKGWIRRIMVNASIDHYRRNEKHYSNVDISYAKNEYVSPDILNSLSEQTIINAIQGLPPSYRIVFNLYCIEGYMHSEIAQKLNISEGTSKSNLNIARIKLKRLLAQKLDINTEQNG